MGITLNEFLHCVLLWLATWHAQMLYRLFELAGVAAQVTDLNSLVLNSLLSGRGRGGEGGTPVQVSTLTSRHRLSTCASAHRRSTGRVFSAFAGLQELVLLSSPFECGSLAVAECVPLRRRATVSTCRVENLKRLRQLQHLQEVQLAQTLIRGRELRFFAQLSLLTTLDVSRCPRLSSLKYLARSISLQVARTARCEALMFVAQVGALAPLRIAAFSDNVLLPTEFAPFIAQTALRLQAGYFAHVRCPRDESAVDAAAGLRHIPQSLLRQAAEHSLVVRRA
ncbi:hypothetical protein LSCM4_01929 [Leishmania orientalis]|uniref:Leucine-rich repeat protein n=1 Tax=Leishmania orientalis TaxID=2249476 RepID=A0A836KDT4_9TRYP|nr:hypothetical protein LSCM4_01929 [Leishmania orientalis]